MFTAVRLKPDATPRSGWSRTLRPGPAEAGHYAPVRL